jgi:elongation factor G
MKEYKTENIKNISVIGSSQIGKTSLGDAILFNTGNANRLGKVNDGTSLLDFDADAIQRKISISSSIYSIETTNNNKINFIDTPGYPAFTSQVITAVNVCESSLVVVGAVAGVEVLTKRDWRLSNKVGQSKFVFINRMDRDQSDYAKVVSQIKALSSKIFPISIPIGNGTTFLGIADILNQKAYYNNTENKMEIKDIPDELKEKVATLRSDLMEAAAENSEELLEKYLEAGTLNDANLIKGIKLGVASNDIIPLMVGSAEKNIGIKKLIEQLDMLAPNPIEKGKLIACTDSNEQEELRQIQGTDPAFVQIFKIEEEAKAGELFYFKVLGSQVNSAQELINFDSHQKERLGHLYVLTGRNKNEVSTLHPGDLGATAKLKSVSIGDTLHTNKDSIKVNLFDFPNPVISQAVKPTSEKDREKLGEGLLLLNKIDPCFINEHRPEFDEVVISGMSKLHLEIMMNKITSKYKIEYIFEKPQIPYRETILGSAQAQGKYKKQTGGHGQYGDCSIEVMGKPVGTGYNFVNKISGGAIPSKFIPAVEKGVIDAMRKGVLAGYPLVDIQVKLYDGSYHTVDSSDLAFQMAGSLSLRKATEQANLILLEPIMNVKVIIPDEYVGDISADFNQRRGKIAGMESLDDGFKMIKAYVPMSEMYQYSVDLKSLTKGEGLYTKAFEKYERVPAHIAKKVIEQQT